MTVAPTAIPRTSTRERIGSVPATVWLSALVAVSFAVRLVLGSWHVVPRLFPDEYIYAALGRSLAHGSLTIRGEPAGFPALLEPLAAAPFWRLAGDDIELGYRLVQGMHALVVSLAAIPMYLIARRIGLSAATALGCAALTLILPVLAWTPAIMADTFALPFVLGAVAAGTTALERPSWRSHLLFLALAGLATLARVQYVILPVAFLAGSLVVVRGDLRRAAREMRPTLLALGVAAGVAAIAGPGRVLGYYEGVTSLSVHPGAVGRWLASDALLTVYAAGWALVPLALVGLVLGITRPRTRGELAFAAIGGPFAALILVEAAVYAANGAERFQGRYVVALVALVPLFAGLGARHLDARGARVGVVGVAIALLLCAAIVPLSGYAAVTGKQDSPTLWAFDELSSRVGTGTAGLVFGLAAGALSLVAAASTLRPRLTLRVTLTATAIALVALSVGAVRYDATQSERTKLTFGDTDQSWVDASGLGDVAVLQTPYASRVQISSQLFWNTSLREILQMEDSSGVDRYGSRAVTVEPDGRIRADGDIVTGPLLVEEYASWAVLDGARLVRRTVNAALWAPRPAPRLSLLLAGRYFDGVLGASSSITIWPGGTGRRVGTVVLPLSMPDDAPSAEITVATPEGERTVVVPSGESVTLRLPVDAVDGPWTAELRATRPLLASGGRLMASLAGLPRFTETSPETGERA